MSSHLEEYLNYYRTLTKPGYGVLVTGAWGVGKTFQVKHCISEEERYYVSLFGLETADQVHAAVFAEIYPTRVKFNMLLSRIGETADAIGGIAAIGDIVAVGRIFPGFVPPFLRKGITPDRVLIFDDLERSDLSEKNLFGVINTYVEHHGFGVIVVAHDKKLADKLSDMKEKLFGQTIRVEPNIEAAFDCFLKQVGDSDETEFIAGHRKTITEIFRQSDVKSLRILRHVVEDLGRLRRVLTEKHLENLVATRALVEVFCAFNIEVRNGGLSESDLRDRMNLWANLAESGDDSNSTEKSPIRKVADKYKNIETFSDVLNSDVLVQMFVEGSYQTEAIQKSLNSSPEFSPPIKLPPWRRVIEFDRFDDAVVDAAVVEMDRQFEDLEITNPGEMMHVFALKMMMADEVITQMTISDVEASCIKYINGLLSSGRLPPQPTVDDQEYDFSYGHGGIKYWVTGATRECFERVKKHLFESRKLALEKKFPALAEELLELVKTDGREFYEQVCFTKSGRNPYARIPILSAMDAKAFVDAWLSSPKENWRIISNALKDRHEGSGICTELSSEKDWVTEVCNQLQAVAEKADGFAALRIRRILPRNLKGPAKEEGGRD